MSESDFPGCTCQPSVFMRWHNDDVLIAWYWPDGPMWLQAAGGPPVEVTSDQFGFAVELGWEPLDVAPGATGIWVTAADGPTYFELVR
ncbi:MAG TPA: hypothetical protein VFV01_17075 [Spirillospora sp.]|nr:hypothetical protein [Spirillospora sp.]